MDVLTEYQRILNQARTVYRANFERMAASGERFSLAVLPVTPQRPRVGVLVEPQGAIDAAIYPGASVGVRDVHAKTEEQVATQFAAWLRTFPLYI